MSIEKDLTRIATALEQIAIALNQKKDIIPISTEKTPDPVPVQEPTTEVAPVEITTVITHEELHDLCLSIVRKDRAKKKEIKTILAARNAELIKDVPETDLPKLKLELEAL